MKFDLNEEQNMLKEAARKFLTEECTSEFVREMAEDNKGYTKEIWEKMSEMGWMGLMIPEEYQGAGMSFLHLAALLSETGYFCMPGPFFSTVVLGSLPIIDAGSEEQKLNILTEIASGKKIMTLATLEQNSTYTPGSIKLKAEKQGSEYLLSGTKMFVPDAHIADSIICSARTGDSDTDITLFLLEAKSSGINIELLETLAGDKQCEVTFENVKVPEENIIGGLNKGWPVLSKVLLMAAVAKCAEMNGIAEKVLEITVQYVKDREQFGKPVGAFQAVQHHCANMLTFADTIKYMTYQTAAKISEGLPFEKDASICKSWVSDSCRELVATAHQVIGGMGFMEEFDLQLYFKRTKAAEQGYGDGNYHRELVAQGMGL